MGVELTQKRLKELFLYDPETGLFTRRYRILSRGRASKIGVTGVFYIDAIDKWDAQIKINYKKHRLGQFKSKLKAVSARWEAEKKYKFPDCSTKSTAYLYLKERNVA
ncbi:MAG: hypothetical protein HN597_16565 [Desulfobacula sp.]|jgi:hypothetical protein|uniref:hypothetical protein n=1 Tax=Desulfobacula sp. TaxID=2593537 RepID=UPI0039B8EE7C|nr:hypothetical protein [Desulfobacula sp.]